MIYKLFTSNHLQSQIFCPLPHKKTDMGSGRPEAIHVELNVLEPKDGAPGEGRHGVSLPGQVAPQLLLRGSRMKLPPFELAWSRLT